MRNKKTWKRLASLLLVGAMAVSLIACGDKGGKNSPNKPEEKDLSWLNTGTSYAKDGLEAMIPIVKEGTEKTISMYVYRDALAGDYKEAWLYKFITEIMNINLEITEMNSNNMEEMLSLAFASNKLPDMIIGAGSYFTNERLVNYGLVEEQIMNMAPYVNETYMPNLCNVYEQRPSWKSAIADGEGRIWSFGNTGRVNHGQKIPQIFMNYDWMEELGKSRPKTADEFLELMRAFKSKGDNIIPITGSYEDANPCVFFLNAFGYMTTDPKGLSAAIRDGQVVIPGADREAYGAYLKYMNTLYSEGLLDPDFYTQDKDAAGAKIAENRTGVSNIQAFLYAPNAEDYDAWWSPNPLTSEYNDKAQWPAELNAISSGAVVVTSACKEPELVARFIDWFYVMINQRCMNHGPNFDYYPKEWGLGNPGWSYKGEPPFSVTFAEMAENPDKWDGVEDYLWEKVRLWPICFGLGLHIDGSESKLNYIHSGPGNGYPEFDSVKDTAELRFDEIGQKNGSTQAYMAMMYEVTPYVTEEVYPTAVYFDAETAARVNELKVVVDAYIEKETAKFITGVRPLSEIDNYFDEVERLGATELLEIYTKYYLGTK